MQGLNTITAHLLTLKFQPHFPSHSVSAKLSFLISQMAATGSGLFSFFHIFFQALQLKLFSPKLCSVFLAIGMSVCLKEELRFERANYICVSYSAVSPRSDRHTHTHIYIYMYIYIYIYLYSLTIDCRLRRKPRSAALKEASKLGLDTDR